MEFNKDFVLVLEKSSHNLKTKKSGSDYYLEGIAAVFGKENSNQRIYEEREYLPHLEYLKEKIEQKRLVGELDHPKEFDVSLKNISHLVEDLSYDKNNRTLKIKVKLLDTPAGKIAKSLVDAGIPVSISSRAAGNVMENKKVQIKKIFTYDLVADPGFENAQLERVYESFGYNLNEKSKKESVTRDLPLINESLGLGKDSNFKIYRINDQEKIQKLLDREPNKMNYIMENNFVTAEEMNGYSKIIKKEMDSIKTSIDSLKSIKENSKFSSDSSLEERVKKLEKYADYLAENLEASIKYGEYLAENLEDSVSYAKYLAENLDKSISYSKYLAEHVDNNISYSEYIAENVDKNIKYSEYLGENLDKSISYSNYLAENLDKNISYSEYLAENVDKNISYSEYLAENLDKGLAYSDYLAEKLSNNINYAEYIAESVNSKIGGGSDKEMRESLSKAIMENSNTSKFSGSYSDLSSKIDNLIQTVDKQKTEQIAENKKYPFLGMMNTQEKDSFLSLHEGQKQKVARALNESIYSSEKEVSAIMGKALNEQDRSGLKFLDMMPEKYRGAWEVMNESQKASVIAQSKFYKLDTEYQIQNFWATRGINTQKANVEKMNESQNQTPNQNPTLRGVSREYLDNISEALGSRFRK
jgi:hypothetical protein